MLDDECYDLVLCDILLSFTCFRDWPVDQGHEPDLSLILIDDGPYENKLFRMMTSYSLPEGAFCAELGDGILKAWFEVLDTDNKKSAHDVI